MTDQEKEIVAKASVPMSIANGFRWLFLVIALLLVLFLFFWMILPETKEQRCQ